MIRAGVLFTSLAALAACEVPPLQIAYEVTAGPVQACPSASCSDVPMGCDAVLNVRILRPSEPLAPYVRPCELVPPNRHRDLCSIANVDLPVSELPNETLEVQVMIWPRNAVKEDPATGELDCREIYGMPTSIGFDLHGFPEESAPSPALGGRAFFHPGDQQTVVTLGCSDLPSVNQPACLGASSIEVAAAVNDFFGAPTIPVFPPLADNLYVWVGEPRYDDNHGDYVLSPTEKQLLKRSNDAWGGFLDDFEPQTAACIEVLEDGSSKTSAVRCRTVTPGERKLDLLGFWLKTERLDAIWQMALGLPVFPPQGLTIGILLDDHGAPAANVQIIPEVSGSTVKYLSDDGTSVIPGRMATTASGLFVSEDAPYGTRFNASRPPLQTATGIGGRIRGKVTIVLLQLGQVAD
ncbi:MAG TPA: hypothetical protein VN253_02675 [Kofleriaceae bacterium]|nr:hypothetical protein [Kofleriaceae bacterium]